MLDRASSDFLDDCRLLKLYNFLLSGPTRDINSSENINSVSLSSGASVGTKLQKNDR